MLQLNREQEQAVRHRDGPMLVLAGPGSGKTAVLTGRIQYLIEAYGVPPEKILVLTFSREAAGEMQERFYRLIGEERACPVHFGTFHAVFYHILKKQGLYNEDSILTQKEKKEYIRGLGKELGVSDYKTTDWQDATLQRIARVKSGGEPELSDPKEEELFRRLYSLYTEKCRRERKLDFDDMISECIRLLTEIPKVLAKWQEKYDYILVDEFQDIDLKQYEVLRLLSGEKRNVFAVGDDDQSIYGFRGACPAVLKRFQEDYPGLSVINLRINYRCKRRIIGEAVSVIEHNTDRLPKVQQAFSEEEGKVALSIFKNACEEALYVAEQVQRLLQAQKDLSIGILYRSVKCSEVLAGELKNRKIAFYQTQSRQFFYDDENVKDILSYFRLAVGTGEKSDLLRILNRPERGLSREALQLREMTGTGKVMKQDFSADPEKKQDSCLAALMSSLSDYYQGDEDKLCYVNRLQQDLRFLSSLPARAALNYVLKGIGYENVLYGRRGTEGSIPESEVVTEFVNELSGRMEKTPYLKEFLERVNRERALFEEEQRKQEAAGKDCREHIVLQTVHASKGLEYDAVFIIGLQEGLFPHKKAEGRSGLEEERRLFYVAMTRARDRLYLCARKKEVFGKRESRFVHELSGKK
ncbi:MAG: ATP-dependent helicase [Lachnospiraceae bacterium]|nr:ATP-dependent helicase [Lachnospiraceae bacterium]